MSVRKEKIIRKVVERGKPKKKWHDDLDPHTKRSIVAVFFFVFAALTLLAYWGMAGFLGRFLRQLLVFLVGQAYFLAPVTFVLVGFSFVFGFGRKLYATTLVGGAFFFVSVLMLTDLFFAQKTGGAIGHYANWPIFKIFDFWGAVIIEAGVFVTGFLMMLNISFLRPKSEEEESEEAEEKDSSENAFVRETAEGLKELAEHVKNAAAELKGNFQKAASHTVEAANPGTVDAASQTVKTADDEEEFSPKPRKSRFGYKKPPLELLQNDRGTPSSGDIRANANIIRRTLQNFGIDVEMGDVSVGPTVTQYTLKPAEGVKLSRIVALHNDLALALAAHPIRIEAPIPGKSLVGIEIPNRSIALVGLRSLFEDRTYQDSPAPLLFALGRDVTGTPVFANLAKMPHLLVAGSTGSGKSVAIHSLITSFFYRNPPEFLKLLIIDPKRVELSAYSGIPHLLTSPITDSKKAIMALRWAVKEMDRRYERLSEAGVRDIAGFNNSAGKNPEPEELMPYLVIVIDELADLMVSFPREVEGSIIRLAQMARAVGIHLIVSTQRPSVEVLTGLIKANITSRIAFQVASQVDSRTILDMAGAEKLLGNGDMLFLAGDAAKPKRIQGGFVSEQEVKKVTDFLKKEAGDDVASGEEIFESDPAFTQSELDFDEFANNDEDGDPLYDEARDLVVKAGKASASYLQRRLKVGYARAARLLDILEERGVIGPGDGAKPREILAEHREE
ncbi:MAG: DNA translocase FtsK [Candidatus Sungbacteria bacterium]|nr:DNA translocase FtsK [Candidatus Sungbacteria bacterium]